MKKHLARGPEGTEESIREDLWAEVRWLINGFNCVRKRELKAGAKLNPDESMIARKGRSGMGDLPHFPFINRKPRPLGLELKGVCDGESGVCLFLEPQEGAASMARKKFQTIKPILLPHSDWPKGEG